MARNTSFIRWAGGKSWLVPTIQELLIDLKFNNYHEPFMGGASVFFAIQEPAMSYLSDTNEELINTFKCVRDNPKRVIEYLSQFSNDEDSYYKIRASEPRGKYQKAARFLYLNAYSFNGLYRVNKQGKYNVPYGFRKNFSIDYDRMLCVSEKLKRTVLIAQDFEEARINIKRGDLVFLDPPYVVPKKSPEVFIKYNQTLFSLDDQYRLAEFVDWIDMQGAYFILTNAYDETIRGIFQHRGHGRVVISERSSLIGGKKAYRGKIPEYIFTNIPERGKSHDEN